MLLSNSYTHTPTHTTTQPTNGAVYYYGVERWWKEVVERGGKGSCSNSFLPPLPPCFISTQSMTTKHACQPEPCSRGVVRYSGEEDPRSPNHRGGNKEESFIQELAENIYEYCSESRGPRAPCFLECLDSAWRKSGVKGLRVGTGSQLKSLLLLLRRRMEWGKEG